MVRATQSDRSLTRPGCRVRAWLGLLAAAAGPPACRSGPASSGGGGEVTGTFSIVAADPETGVCGAAVASKYPSVGKVVPHVRADGGAAPC